MKQMFAAVILLAALGVFCKLAWKGSARTSQISANIEVASGPADASAIREDQDILARYPRDRDLVQRTLKKYRQTARSIEATDGLPGLALLDRLDLEAIYLYEKHPKDFRRLRESLTDVAAADLISHWNAYFGLKRADDLDRAVLIEEIARLSPTQRKIASKYPNALPLILADPDGMTALIERLDDQPSDLADALVVLDLVSLDQGAANLRSALRTLDSHGPLALEAFRQLGAEGFALVGLYGPIVNAVGDALPLDQTLILLRVNTDDVDAMLAQHGPEVVAGHLRHVAAVGLVEAVGGNPHALQLVVEYGDRGEQALRNAGPDAADVVYQDYADPALRTQAVAALAEHGTMALAMLDKYATAADFRDVLRTYGPAAIPPIAQADISPAALAALKSKSHKSFTENLAQGILQLSGDNGQATIRRMQTDGLDRVQSLNADGVAFYQFLPLYDILHLGGVVTRGQAPTSGEMAWALVDGCFVVADVLSLTALQPEGAAAVEVARTEVKAAVREGSKVAGREAVQDATEAASKAFLKQGAETVAERASRWWAVRAAGGTYRLMQRMPEALKKMTVAEMTEVGRTFAAKAGMRLSEFGPKRLLKDGHEFLLAIPPARGLKYLAAQGVQAGVGLMAIHKMEEHLASRRPPPPSTP